MADPEYIDTGTRKFLFRSGPNGSLLRIKKKEPPVDLGTVPNKTAKTIGSLESLEDPQKKLYTLKNVNGRMVYTR